MSLPIPRPIPGSTQTVAVSGTSAQSAALSGATNLIRLVATTNCHVTFGSSPSATTGNLFLVANVPEYFAVASPTHKVAVIQNAASGNLYITEVVT